MRERKGTPPPTSAPTGSWRSGHNNNTCVALSLSLSPSLSFYLSLYLSLASVMSTSSRCVLGLNVY